MHEIAYTLVGYCIGYLTVFIFYRRPTLKTIKTLRTVLNYVICYDLNFRNQLNRHNIKLKEDAQSANGRWLQQKQFAEIYKKQRDKRNSDCFKLEAESSKKSQTILELTQRLIDISKELEEAKIKIDNFNRYN
jgi:hypothetical protein